MALHTADPMSPTTLCDREACPVFSRKICHPCHAVLTVLPVVASPGTGSDAYVICNSSAASANSEVLVV
ncbi:hypothetical protein FKM82_017419 [Ascaphus truei]